jgi:type IV secretory pathway protease TraF
LKNIEGCPLQYLFATNEVVLIERVAGLLARTVLTPQLGRGVGGHTGAVDTVKKTQERILVQLSGIRAVAKDEFPAVACDRKTFSFVWTLSSYFEPILFQSRPEKVTAFDYPERLRKSQDEIKF